MNSKHRGALNEILTTAHFLAEGYEVFRNTSQHGPADLIVWKPETGELILIDVKEATSFKRKDGATVVYIPQLDEQSDVRRFYVSKGEVIGFGHKAERI